jgi:TPP-dependent pyruvate/acetoin dehydrogenase alpha subunit
MRRFEKRAYDLFLQNLVKGTSHLSLGMEAIAAGFGEAMRARGDYTFCTYRGHAHTLARGVPMTAGAGRAAGARQRPDGGKGGSMHLTERRARRDGLLRHHRRAPAHRLRRRVVGAVPGAGQVAVCFFGDGTTNIGAFHEALNFAAVWKLPVVFVCENNLYMEYTPIAT